MKLLPIWQARYFCLILYELWTNLYSTCSTIPLQYHTHPLIISDLSANVGNQTMAVLQKRVIRVWNDNRAKYPLNTNFLKNSFTVCIFFWVTLVSLRLSLLSLCRQNIKPNQHVFIISCVSSNQTLIWRWQTACLIVVCLV